MDENKAKLADDSNKKDKPKKELSGKGLILILLLVNFIFIAIVTITVVLLITKAPDGVRETKPSKKSTQTIEDTMGQLVPMREFLVNLKDYGGRRYLKTTITLEADTAEVVAEITTKEAVLRNYIINVLSSMTYQEIDSVEGKNELRKTIILKSNYILKRGKILNVYFSEFIIQ